MDLTDTYDGTLVLVRGERANLEFDYSRLERNIVILLTYHFINLVLFRVMGSAVSAKKPPPVHHAEPEVSHHWKMLPSIDEARANYREDGTLAKSVDPGHLELRTLLEEPLGQHSIGNYAKANHAHESFMCWVDLQEFKTIPDDAFQYRRSKALHIHQKYIKTGAASEFGGMEPEEREGYYQLLLASKDNQSLLPRDFYDKVQMQCFVDIFQNVFKRYKATEDYAKLKKSK